MNVGLRVIICGQHAGFGPVHFALAAGIFNRTQRKYVRAIRLDRRKGSRLQVFVYVYVAWIC
jgi:hypothetical protein